MKFVSTAAALATLLVSIPSFAQEEDEAPEAATDEEAETEEEEPEETEEAPAAAETSASMSASTSSDAAPVSESEGPTGASDHEQMVGRFAVGYMGRESILIGAPLDPANPVVAPIIGVRYWLDPTLGLDIGAGFNMSGGSTRNGDNDPNQKVGVTGGLIHVGVPISLSHVNHFSFQITPEANVGLASTGDFVPGADELRLSGFHVSAGARAGAEIHFGFMSIPQLSLQGSVGLYFQYESGVEKTVNGGAVNRNRDFNHTLGTSLGADPWDIFTSNISALYYF